MLPEINYINASVADLIHVALLIILKKKKKKAENACGPGKSHISVKIKSIRKEPFSLWIMSLDH